MKLLFSEAKSDYGNYIFPYAIWAFPEFGETPADLFEAGFLPSSRHLDRFYLCRQLRVELSKFEPSSENRRILRKGESFELQWIPRHEFEFTPERRAFCLRYADTKFGAERMSVERLDLLFSSPVTTHLLVFTDPADQKDIGIVTLYVEPGRIAFYYYAFYDLAYANRSLGMFMMTAAVGELKARGFRHVHLGTCYSAKALYKTQFLGVEFFNGFKWSPDLSELKYLLDREGQAVSRHLLENEDFHQKFHPAGLGEMAAGSHFRGTRS